jgi:hypothetical protein
MYYGMVLTTSLHHGFDKFVSDDPALSMGLVVQSHDGW